MPTTSSLSNLSSTASPTATSTRHRAPESTQSVQDAEGLPNTQALPDSHPMRDGRTAGSALITAYRGAQPDRRPVWFMRQAGRSLPEYLRVRAGTGMLEACLTPDLATEITLQPVRRHGVDAAILFSDIVVPLRLAGVGVEIVAGTGPVAVSYTHLTLPTKRIV